MGLFADGYGDTRRDAAMGRLHGAMVEQSPVAVRRLGGARGGEMSGHRVLLSWIIARLGGWDCYYQPSAHSPASARAALECSPPQPSPGRRGTSKRR